MRALKRGNSDVVGPAERVIDAARILCAGSLGGPAPHVQFDDMRLLGCSEGMHAARAGAASPGRTEETGIQVGLATHAQSLR